MKSNKTIHTSSSPQYRNSSSNKKFVPYEKEIKRLSILLTDCRNFQSSIVKTLKNIDSDSYLNSRKLRKLQKKLDTVQDGQGFKGSKMKLPKSLEGPKKESEVKQAINSILKTPRVLASQRGENKERNQVNYEILQTFEAIELLKCNKREFGNHFRGDLREPIKKNKKKSQIFLIKEKNKPYVSSTPGLAVSPKGFSLQHKEVYRNSICDKDKGVIGSVLGEKRKVSQMVKMEKLLHEKLQKH